MQLLAYVAWTGVGATLTMDVWMLVRRRMFGMPLPDYGHVGRWLGHMRNGRFVQPAIAEAAPVRHEAAIGWVAHYLIGIGFAALLPLWRGAEWFQAPTPGPALAVGLGTVLAPFLLMQPGMGAGIAARRTRRPNLARMHSLITHAAFGLGLFAAARVLCVLVAA